MIDQVLASLKAEEEEERSVIPCSALDSTAGVPSSPNLTYYHSLLLYITPPSSIKRTTRTTRRRRRRLLCIMSSASTPPTNTQTQPRRTSFGVGNDGIGGGYYKNLEKKRRGSQTQSDLHADMYRRDTIGDAWSKLFK